MYAAYLIVILKKLVTAVGIIKGSISFEILGSKGFGYDPIFIPESEKITFGQMQNLKKNEN